MWRNIKYIIMTLFMLGAGCMNSSPENDAGNKITTVWLIGDSTVTDYSQYENYMSERYPVTGWGQVFQQFMTGAYLSNLKELLLSDSIEVKNRAVGGRSTRTFFQEGRWREVYESIKQGDIVLIQFGHNDASVNKAERYVDLNGYMEFLRLFIHQSRKKSAIPILITPVARNYPWVNDTLTNVHGEYPKKMKEVAAETGTMIIDLNQMSMNHFTAKGRAYVTENYFMNLPPGAYEAYPKGEDDNTHFQPEGATEVAQLVFKGLVSLLKQHKRE
jgi:lysophospholipase L1-like esterase